MKERLTSADGLNGEVQGATAHKAISDPSPPEQKCILAVGFWRKLFLWGFLSQKIFMNISEQVGSIW